MNQNVLAIDIGASGGRHILGTVTNGRIQLEEIYRFTNQAVEKNGRLCWDIDALWEHILEGLRQCKRQNKIPCSVGVDTWAVDYALIDQRGNRMGDCVAYRDSRTVGMDTRLEKTLSFRQLYQHTGIAKLSFNTIYQLMAEPAEALERAKRCLLIPDWFHHLLCGATVNEFSNASTTALLSATTHEWDHDVMRAAGIPASLFPETPVMPGTRLGRLRPEIAEQVGFTCDVVLPATHDTGSAFMAVPALDDRAVYLSSGTWSLLGVQQDAPILGEDACWSGFTNEGGFGGSVRFLHNIMGLWILQCLRSEWQKRYSFAQMSDLAKEGSDYGVTLDVSAQRFLAPKNMEAELKAAIREQGDVLPATDGELLACVNRSLALCYAQGVHRLETLTGKRYASMNIVGGGSQNHLLNQWTANATGLTVLAGPTEGTALGNVLAQLIAYGEIADLAQGRELIKASFPLEVFEPGREA